MTKRTFVITVTLTGDHFAPPNLEAIEDEIKHCVDHEDCEVDIIYKDEKVEIQTQESSVTY